jgi:predicted nucleic acid-binding protein
MAALAYNRAMEQVAKIQPFERAERPCPACPLVFVDTNVILGYIQGDPAATQLFSVEAEGRIRFAVNGIVLQEILLTKDAAGGPEFQNVIDHLRVLPIDMAKAEALVPRAQALRNRMPHSNDLLILSSADECDFLVTSDVRLKDLVAADKPQIVTPEELVAQLKAA